MDNYKDYVCVLCKKLAKEKRHFWAEHRISEARYFELHEPKFDLLTGERISFKGSYDNYSQTDFAKRINIKKYIESLSNEGARTYLKKWLNKRIKSRKILFPPTEFEIRQLQFPSIQYLEKHFGENFYSEICLDVGLLARFMYPHRQLDIDNDKNLEFIVDTREQCVLKFDGFAIQKLDIGDYTIVGEDVFIERKSLNDFIGTMSQGYDRFNREIQRAVVGNKYVIVLIEEKYAHLASYKFLPHMKKVKAEPYFIHHRVREMMQNYPVNMQFLAVDGRGEASRVIEKIFRLSHDVKNLDLQLCYNKGIL